MKNLKCVHHYEWRAENFPLLEPLWYENSEVICRIAQHLQRERNQSFYQLPFDTTLEAHCLGVPVKWDACSIYGRISKPLFSTETVDLKQLDNYLEACISNLAKSPIERLKGTLESIRLLKVGHLPIVINLTGPITLASHLFGFENYLRLQRKNKEATIQLQTSLDAFYDVYLQHFIDMGIDLISYADPLGNMEVLGELYFKQWSLPLQSRQLQHLRAKNKPVHVCGNLSSAMATADCFPYPKGDSSVFKAAQHSSHITGISCIQAWK